MIGRWSKSPVEEDQQPRSFDDFELKLGDVMRGERATMGKSLLDVQRELKIKATYISAIEHCDPTVFETQGFIAGYVRSYARYLNLDPDWSFSRFCAESGFSVAHGMSPAASAPRPKNARLPIKGHDPFADPNAVFVPRGEGFLSRIEPGALGSTAVLIALICGIGYGGWSVLQEIQRVDMAPVDQAPGVIAEVEELAAPEMVIAGLDSTSEIVQPRAEALDRLYRPQALDAPVMVPRDGPIATLDPTSIGVLAEESAAERLALAESAIAEAAATFEEATIQVVEADVPELALVAVRPAWVRVQSSDGTIMFEKILDAGEQYIVPKLEEPPVLRTGNGGGVYFAVNGDAFGPAGSNGSVVKNIALSIDGLSTQFASVDLQQDELVAEMFQVAQNSALEEIAPLGE